MMKTARVPTKDILAKIQDVCADIAGVEPYDVSPGTYLIEDLGFTPGDLQSLYAELEEEYQLTFQPEDIERARKEDMTVLELIDVVEAGM